MPQMLSGRGKDFYLLTMGSQLSKTTKCWVIGNGIFKGQILSHPTVTKKKGGRGDICIWSLRETR